MKLATATQMRELDRAAIEKHGIPSLVLMERAGEGVAAAVRRILPPGGRVALLCGGGNNGGDGLVAARHLALAGVEVFVVVTAALSDLSPDARANFEALAPLSTRIFTARTPAELASIGPQIAQAACVVDALLGTGLAREVSGVAAAAVGLINSVSAKVVSVDLPSGLSSDTGLPHGSAVKADITVTFGLPKRGLFVGEGLDYAGRVETVDIGIPAAEVEALEAKLHLIEPSIFRAHFGKRHPASHKGNFGHVAVFAGSRGHLGAGFLSSLAALRAGAGLLTYCLPEKAFAKFDARYPEVMCEAIPDEGKAIFCEAGLDAALKACEGKSAVVLGPAIGTERETSAFVNAFVSKAKAPLVVDADGLNVLDPKSLSGRRAPTILTPHPGEMGKLLGVSTREVEVDRIGAATRLAGESGAISILKGRGTIVATPEGQAGINPTGNAGMATAGMGDALTGIIAAFLAGGMDAWTAACAGVWVHGAAGDIAAAEHGERALITSDVIRKLGDAMREAG